MKHVLETRTRNCRFQDKSFLRFFFLFPFSFFQDQTPVLHQTVSLSLTDLLLFSFSFPFLMMNSSLCSDNNCSSNWTFIQYYNWIPFIVALYFDRLPSSSPSSFQVLLFFIPDPDSFSDILSCLFFGVTGQEAGSCSCRLM